MCEWTYTEMEGYNKGFKITYCTVQFTEVVEVKTKKRLDEFFNRVAIFFRTKSEINND